MGEPAEAYERQLPLALLAHGFDPHYRAYEMYLVGQLNDRNKPESPVHFELLVKPKTKHASVSPMQRKDKLGIRNGSKSLFGKRKEL
jgi:hypothetical protein